MTRTGLLRQFHEQGQVDWSKGDVLLSEDYPEIGLRVIAKFRKQMGIPRGSCKRGDAKIIKKRYAGVDWTKRNYVIAAELGVSREAVGKARSKLKLPLPEGHKYGRPTVHDYGRIRKAALKHPGWSRKHLREKFGVSNSTLDRILVGIKRPCHYPWPLIDLRLRNSDIAQIWEIPISTIDRQREKTGMFTRKFRLLHIGADYWQLLQQQHLAANKHRDSLKKGTNK